MATPPPSAAGASSPGGQPPPGDPNKPTAPTGEQQGRKYALKSSDKRRSLQNLKAYSQADHISAGMTGLSPSSTPTVSHLPPPPPTLPNPAPDKEEKKSTAKKEKGFFSKLFKKESKTPSAPSIATSEERFTDLVNELPIMRNDEAVCRAQVKRLELLTVAMRNKDQPEIDRLDRNIALKTDEFENTSERLKKTYKKYKVASSEELGLLIIKELEVLLKDQKEIEFVCSFLMQNSKNYEPNVLSRLIVQLDVPLIMPLLKSMLVNEELKAEKRETCLRQASLTTDLFRDLHYKIYGHLIKPIVANYVQRFIFQSQEEAMKNPKAIVIGLLTDIQNALHTQVPQSDQLHALYAFVRKKCREQHLFEGKVIPLMCNFFLLRVIGNLITNPTQVGLPSYPEGDPNAKNPLSKEASASKELSKIMMSHAAVEVDAKSSLTDAEMGQILKNILMGLDPENRLDIQRYGNKPLVIP